MSQFSFSNLTPEHILDAVESLGIYPETGLLALNSYENRVYQFKADDGLRYVTKFYRPHRWTQAQILEEHAFAFELQDAEIPVVAPITRDGDSLFEHDGYSFTVYPSVGGRSFEADNLDNLEYLGQLLGRVHQVGEKQQFASRTTLGPQTHLVEALRELEQSPLIPSTYKSRLIELVEELKAKVVALYRPNNQIRLHGDCHAGNILSMTEGLCLVDLDDACMGPAVQDLWMMLSGDRQSQMVQLDTLLCGYEMFRDFPRSELEMIESLRTMRMVNYMAWLSKRFDDPAFKSAFSWFATPQYWEQQLKALEEQILAMESPALTLWP
ncbi:serine/threonine protein kinase [Pseudoalteromonas xiamenensis]|uniref:serine/threonine protein kinase n=1 Tax=Pseudoalteromonas xiamenensis TaxID=882626 RepID=UPI0027E54076|nr:serine/threonine protein kinase [Pseudoalteromonas xiamenensis]WMN58772.1 serine/threonine protein kinase [Pseudoalteromonas xiamenensis]